MKAHDEYLPWQQLTEISLGVLGLAPEIFWAMTPVEWLAALSGWKRKFGIVETPTPDITRNDLEGLMSRFPD